MSSQMRETITIVGNSATDKVVEFRAESCVVGTEMLAGDAITMLVNGELVGVFPKWQLQAVLERFDKPKTRPFLAFWRKREESVACGS